LGIRNSPGVLPCRTQNANCTQVAPGFYQCLNSGYAAPYALCFISTVTRGYLDETSTWEKSLPSFLPSAL
jgi:hypothetical protein